MSEERFVEIETRLAHQDQALLELSDALANQQAMIIQLERLAEVMSTRLVAIGEAMPEADPGDEVPPHY